MSPTWSKIIKIRQRHPGWQDGEWFLFKREHKKNQKVKVAINKYNEFKKEEEDLQGGDNKDRVGVLKVNNKQQEQMLGHDVNPSPELKGGKSMMFKETKEEESNALSS